MVTTHRSFFLTVAKPVVRPSWIDGCWDAALAGFDALLACAETAAMGKDVAEDAAAHLYAVAPCIWHRFTCCIFLMGSMLALSLLAENCAMHNDTQQQRCFS